MTAGTHLPFSTADDAEIRELLSTYQIGLTVQEARKITELLGRDPTIVEAVIWGIQGSEHCSYKSSRRFLRRFATSGKHVILGPVEDSGIVAITDEPEGKRWGLAISHESHNHPSQIVPFEGAATGIGGVVRDIVCMGARVIGCMDMLRLGDLQTAESRTIAKEVIRGIGGYGNPLGVPNLGGDTAFDAAYNSNCLVNAVAVGIVREDEIIHSMVPQEAGREGYEIIIVGKPTDRSGFGGAAFASASMEEEKREQNSGAVQEPNPFLERHLLASTYALFDWLVAEGKLAQVSCKDLGAGGVVCASVEQVADCGLGAQIDLGAVHTAIPDLPAEVIACAETQERLCWICHPSLTQHILQHYNDIWDLPSVAENARASVIGHVTEEPIFRATHNNVTVCEADARAITCGLQYERPTKAYTYSGAEPDLRYEKGEIRATVDGKTHEWSIKNVWEAMITHRNGCSRQPAFVHFDKNVIGNTVLEPGEADATVIAPLQDLQSYVHEGVHPGWEDLPEEHKWAGVALAAGGTGRYGRISPYWQGVNAATEAMRNAIAVGAEPRALTDCLNYGNPEVPEQLWQLEEGVRGIIDAAKGMGTEESIPVISGNVSLYNSKPDGSAIDPTAIVACAGVLPDARKAIGIQVRTADSALYMIGERRNECGGSLYYDVLEQLCTCPRNTVLGTQVPQPVWKEERCNAALVSTAVRDGMATACHDISEGGLLMALFEMLLPQRKRGGTVGAIVDIALLQSTVRPDQLLFSETGGYLLEVPPEQEAALQECAVKQECTIRKIGTTTNEALLHLSHNDTVLLKEPLANMVRLWQGALSQHLR